MINRIKRTWKKIVKTASGIHCVSDTLKLPIFDKKVISRLFGLQIAGLAAALSFVSYPAHAFDYNLAQTATREAEIPFVVTTKTQYVFPLEMTLGMSQSYHALHPGVDLRAPRGTAVYAMDEGTVVEVEQVLVGYGHFVRIAHKGTLSTLYAHLDKVQVKPGEKVAKGQTIGDVGMTGWTTGPHLHFEIYVGDKSVNPTNYIGQVPFRP